jgi:hypothetical protein
VRLQQKYLAEAQRLQQRRSYARTTGAWQAAEQLRGSEASYGLMNPSTFMITVMIFGLFVLHRSSIVVAA